MTFVGAPRVAHRVGRYVASAVRRRGQLCTVVNPQSSTYRSGKVVQTNRATSADGPTFVTLEGIALKPILNPNGPLGYLL